MSRWTWLRRCVVLVWEDWAEDNAPLFPINMAMLAACLLYRYGGALR